jgi:hypothetical protein
MKEVVVTYLPGVFDVADQDAAKRIILTADGASTDHRWSTETPYLACSPEMLDELVARGLVCDAAISIWVLQHCPRLADDIVRIAHALKPGGDLFVVNQRVRVVPTVEHGWLDDGLDVFGLLRSAFEVRGEGPLAAAHTTDVIATIASWAAFKRL